MMSSGFCANLLHPPSSRLKNLGMSNCALSSSSGANLCLTTSLQKTGPLPLVLWSVSEVFVFLRFLTAKSFLFRLALPISRKVRLYLHPVVRGRVHSR